MGEDILTSAGMAMTEEQQSMPLRDAVFMSLRKAILTGKLKPGDRLTEVKLGKLLGTSRTPIREAIRLLELDGLVTIVAGSGARVSRMTVEDLQEVIIQDDLRYEHLIAEHLDIYNAIVSGNREEAEKAAQVHIDHQYKAIREQLLSEKGDQ